MRRYAKSIWIVVIASIFIFYFSGFINGYRMKKTIQSSFGHMVPIYMGKAYINAYTGNGYIRDIRIPNPNAFSGGNALVIKEIKLSGGPMSLRGDELHFHTISFDGVEMQVLQNDKGNNIVIIVMEAFQKRGTYYSQEMGMKKVRFDQFSIGEVSIFFGLKIMQNPFQIKLDPIAIHKNLDDPVLSMRQLGITLGHLLLSQLEDQAKQGKISLQDSSQRSVGEYLRQAREFLNKAQ